jgi:hypothetical protein
VGGAHNRKREAQHTWEGCAGCQPGPAWWGIELTMVYINIDINYDINYENGLALRFGNEGAVFCV